VLMTELSNFVTASNQDSKLVSSEMDEGYWDLAQLLCISGRTKNCSLIRHIQTVSSGHVAYYQVDIGRKAAQTTISPLTSTESRG
jgi:hypothetical protein